MQMLYMMVGISRQAHFKAVQRDKRTESLNMSYLGLMYEIRTMHPGMGLRKMYEQFSPEGIGRDAFISFGLSEGFRLTHKKNATRTTYSVKSSRYRNLLAKRVFTDVNQLWVSDITYYSFGGIHYYIIFLMDVYSRRILGYKISDNMKASNNIKTLEMAMTNRGIYDYNDNLIHHSDKGSQYISNDYTDLLDESNILISMCNNVYENTHCERVNSTIKNEYLARWPAKTPRQLFRNLDKAVDNYNQRKHNSIKMTPLQYEAKITKLSIQDRDKMEIYTSQIDPFDKNQLIIQFGL
jgi:hypothetical protein